MFTLSLSVAGRLASYEGIVRLVRDWYLYTIDVNFSFFNGAIKDWLI